ncbi:hypothetical protein BH10BAC2_BH10BAC2_21260 [soil metagenome]
MVGVYGNGYTPGQNYDTVKASTFIAGGIARLTQSPYSYFFTSMQLKVPLCHNFSGDSARIEVTVKNPSTGPYAFADHDVSITILGAKNTAQVVFIGYRKEFTNVSIGSKKITNLPELLYVFQDYTTNALEAKDGVLNVYNKGTLVFSTPYKGADRIGNVKGIAIGFKGAGSIDVVKAFNTNSGAQIMQEDFNIDGTSNVIWY